MDRKNATAGKIRRKSLPDGSLLCTGCGAFKLPSEYHTEKWTANGRKPKCKQCTASIKKAKRKTQIVDGKQQCRKCSLFKDMSEYVHQSNRICSAVCQQCRSKKYAIKTDGNGNIQCIDCHEWKPKTHFMTRSGRRIGIVRVCFSCGERRDIVNRGKSMKSFLTAKLKSTMGSKLAYERRRLSGRRKHLAKNATLTIDDVMDVYEQQGGKCFITGMQMTHVTGRGVVTTNASIDRIDNTIGYHKDNIRLVCVAVNYMRNSMADSEMVAWAKMIARYKPRAKIKDNEQLALFA